MLKPVKLFGVEQRDLKVILIHDEGEGYWFVSHGCKTVGDAKSLSKISTELEKRELKINYLILGIINDHKQELLDEYCTKNPNGLEHDKLEAIRKDDKETLNHLESYIRQQFGELNLLHPVISLYKEQFTELLTNEWNFQYQLACVECAFKYRVVTDPSIIKVHSDDSEKGTIYTKILTNSNDIGMHQNLDRVPEPLATKIYLFMQNEFNKRPTLTTKEQEQQKLVETKPTIDKVEVLEEEETDDDEKKLLKTK